VTSSEAQWQAALLPTARKEVRSLAGGVATAEAHEHVALGYIVAADLTTRDHLVASVGWLHRLTGCLVSLVWLLVFGRGCQHDLHHQHTPPLQS